MKKLKGMKTILGSTAIGVIVIVHSLLPNLIDGQIIQALLGAVVTFTGVSMRLAIKKP